MIAEAVLLIILDDVGREYLERYALGGEYANTPHINELIDGGQLWTEARAMPVCSPTRAGLLTGLYPYRHGLGTGVPLGEYGLDPNFSTLPELISKPTAIFGKWHLGTGADAALNAGFDYASVTEANLTSYYFWHWYVNGIEEYGTGYIPEATTDAALAWLSGREEYFAVVAYHLAHAPWHCPQMECEPGRGGETEGMIEELDRQIGRLLDGISSSPVVILLGDNGSAIARDPYERGRVKGTVYEGGVRVPLVISGPGITQATQTQRASVVDLFATILDLLGVGIPSNAGMSLVPWIVDPTTAPAARVLYSEIFSPYGVPRGAGDIHRQAAWAGRYKLIRQLDRPDEFYDLQADPYERADLLRVGELTERQEAAYVKLSAYIDGTW